MCNVPLNFDLWLFPLNFDVGSYFESTLSKLSVNIGIESSVERQSKQFVRISILTILLNIYFRFCFLICDVEMFFKSQYCRLSLNSDC